MLELQKSCANHPDREAIARCIITGKAICAECSTRHEGVNYSREGLEILRQRRLESSAKRPRRVAGLAAVGVGLPVMLWLTHQFYVMSFISIIEILQADR